MVFRQRENLIKTLICIGIVAATFVAYEPIRHNGFVGYDDPKYITQNPNVTGGITRQSLIWAFTKSYSANWHPLTWVSHMLDCQLFKLNPLGHHSVSLLFHITNALLLFWILTTITKAMWPSAFVAAVFALHPLHVESVAWAAERKDVLSGLFWMLTVLAYIRYAKQPNFKRYVLVLLAFAMGLMAKPMLVTLPFVLLLLDYWPLERLTIADLRLSIENRKFFNLLLEKVPLFVLSAASCVMTLIAQHSGGAITTLENLPVNYRIANMFVSYIRYLGKTIWPSRLAVLYPPTNANFTQAAVVISALLFVLILVLSIHIGRRKKYMAAGWLWYVGTLVPVIGLVQVGSQSIANRYMYIPMVGLLIIVAWFVKNLVANKPRRKIVAAVLTAIVLSSAVIATRMQVKHWQNDIALFGYAVNVTKDNAPAENNYGTALFKAGQLNEAVLHLNNAVRLFPEFIEARNNLGKALLKQGKPAEAIACFNELIKRKQDSAEVRYNLALALGMQNKYDEAIKHLSSVLNTDPNYPDAHNRMAIALMAAGKQKEAIEHFNEALRTNYNQPEVYANLGMAYVQMGNYGPAIQNLTKAAELKPDRVDILNALAWTLVTAGDVSVEGANRAVEFAHRACKLTEYKEPSILDTLAAAYAAGGRFNEAIATAQQAIDTAKANKQNKLAEKIQSRLELYKAGQPYRQKRMTDDR